MNESVHLAFLIRTRHGSPNNRLRVRVNGSQSRLQPTLLFYIAVTVNIQIYRSISHFIAVMASVYLGLSEHTLHPKTAIIKLRSGCKLSRLSFYYAIVVWYIISVPLWVCTKCTIHDKALTPSPLPIMSARHDPMIGLWISTQSEGFESESMTREVCAILLSLDLLNVRFHYFQNIYPSENIYWNIHHKL